MKLPSIQMPGDITNYSLWVCLWGLTHCGREFGDFVCFVPQIMSLIPSDSQRDR